MTDVAKNKSQRRRRPARAKRAVLGRTAWAYVFLLPVFVFLSIFTYYMIAYNVNISFYNWNGVSANKVFIGMQNYVNMFKDPYFRVAMKNVLIYFLITIPVQAVLGFALALCLRQSIYLKGIARSMVFLPNILSLVVIGYVFSQIYNFQYGFLNAMLRGIGLDSWARDWTGDGKLALYSVIFANIYTYIGFSMTLYISGMLGIPKDVREAATIDGATAWNAVRFIDIPLLLSTHVTITILGIVGTLKTFDIVWLITKGGPARLTEMPATFLYRAYILEYKAGYAAAVAVVIMVVALILSVINLVFQRRNAIQY